MANRSSRHVIGAIALLATACTTTPAPSAEPASGPCPLPTHLQSDWGGSPRNGFGHRIRLLPDQGEVAATRAVGRITFDTSAQTLDIAWEFMEPGSIHLETSESFTLGFQPTAVCRGGGWGTVFYVAGYAERTCQVVIEKWTVQNLAIGSALPAGGSTSPQTVATKTIRREMILASTALPPIASMVFHSGTDELWLLTDGFPHTIHTFQTEAANAVPVPHADSRTPGYAALQHAGWISGTVAGTQAPDGGGFLMLFQPKRAWEGLDDIDPSLEDDCLLLRDIGCNGSLEEVVTGTFDALMVQRAYLIHEDPDHEQCH